MSEENTQAVVFKKILDDLEKVCVLNKQIKESVEALNVDNDEEVDRTYEALHSSLETSEKALSDIVVYFKKSKNEWLESRNKKIVETTAVNGTKAIKSEEDEGQPKVGLLKLVSLDKLLDPSRLNDKENDAVIVLSDAESEATEQTQKKSTTTQLRRILVTSVTRKHKTNRPLRHRTVRKNIVLDSDSDSEEEIRYRKSRRCYRKRNDSSSSDVVTQKKSKITGKQQMSDSSSNDGEIDVKLRWQACVSLPRVKCEDLEEYYLNKPDVFLPKTCGIVNCSGCIIKYLFLQG